MNAIAEITSADIRQATATLERMRRLLEQDVSEEASTLATPAEDRGEDTTPSQHPADVATDLEQHELLLIRELSDTAGLRDVEDALERIATGTYGACVDCGRPIPMERLEIRPQAARDVECERRYESKRARR